MKMKIVNLKIVIFFLSIILTFCSVTQNRTTQYPDNYTLNIFTINETKDQVLWDASILDNKGREKFETFSFKANSMNNNFEKTYDSNEIQQIVYKDRINLKVGITIIHEDSKKDNENTTKIDSLIRIPFLYDHADLIFYHKEFCDSVMVSKLFLR